MPKDITYTWERYGWLTPFTPTPFGTSGSPAAALPANLAPSVALLGGIGAPPASLGLNGNYYFRTDTPATALQRIYVKSAGAWVGIV